MSKHRVVKSDFWIDDYFEEESIKEKYFFLYLLTNPETNILGIYRTTIKRICFETGLTKPEVTSFLEKWAKMDKVYFIESYILMVNFQKHNLPSGTMKRGIEKLILNLPFEITSFILLKESNIYNRLSIGYLDSIHRANKDKDKDINKSKGKNNDKDPENPNSKNEAPPKKYSKLFEDYWLIFPPNPTHGKGDKGKAFIEFKKVPVEEHSILWKGTINFGKNTGGSYKCARFLKEEIWRVHLKPITENQNGFNQKPPEVTSESIAEAQNMTNIQENSILDITPETRFLNQG